MPASCKANPFREVIVHAYSLTPENFHDSGLIEPSSAVLDGA